MLSLTFDDGPDARWTRAVQRALARCDAQATFFVIGERVRANRGLMDELLTAGHDVQLHCDRHIRHSELSEPEIELDVRAALASLAQHGVHPGWWRTPWGVRTPATRAVAQRHGLKLVNWSLDTEDWRGEPASAMLARIEPLADGDVVLMHDGIGPGALRDGCAGTVELIGKIVAAARAASLEVGPLGGPWLPALTGSGAQA
ncbi:MAG: polysaccharide deacetylase family protein [Solirubrobacteraceae bacterium]